MFRHNLILFNVCVYVITVLYHIDIVHATRCSRIPEGSSNKYRSVSPGNFRIRILDDSDVYKPGRTYTVRLERNSNVLKGRDQARQTFTGFYLTVEQKRNSSGDIAEEFTPSRHGAFKLIEQDPLTKLICGNVATHQSDSNKMEVEINWTAPEAGSGCVTFRATVIEHRDFWYKDDGLLTRDFCEDEEVQEDFISNILEKCCACHEAKYELTFEGLWSRNTHPKGFPRNVYTTKFGDIIGATHKIDSGFWVNGEIASEGLKEVAETGSTRTLEAELKDKSDSIRTIIKARGLSFPNITGKTFAVFRVDAIHHLVSFVSMISPSPDWFVGISSLELCQEDCSWVENKIIDLYPWDAGTDKGVTYDAPDQPSRKQDVIRRITSESPSNVESPFFNPSGLKMKPLARLTLLRQRLYEKNCSAGQTAADDCHVSEYDDWGECTGAVCGQMGKQYRQRYYKNVDSATKCNRKLFETKICMMAPCRDDDNNSGTIAVDDDCIIVYDDWSECLSNCTQIQQGRYRQDKVKDCRFRPETGPMVKMRKCSGGRCKNENEQTDEQTDDTATEETTTECEYEEWEDSTECNVSCGSGFKNQIRRSKDPRCKIDSRQIPCMAREQCRNKDFCKFRPNIYNCERSDSETLYFFYDATTCTCNQVFSSTCRLKLNANMFERFDDCKEACPEDDCRR